MKIINIKLSIVASLVAMLISCSQEPAPVNASAYQEVLMETLILAKPGDIIEIPEGKFDFTRALSLKVSNVTIKGSGMDKSILSFKGQIQGAEGFIITANDIVLQDFAIEDAKGDALKINECKNLIIRNLRVEWTNGPDEKNGAYGIYPVQCENVLIDGAVAIGASDAGIYVGQSNQVIVKNSRAEFNVAGIEIENTTNADVFDNVATNNTGGVLVFNMPNLPQPGAKTRVYNNTIVSNNTDNFGAPGTAVASVPAGSGVVINSNDEVEIFDNTIADNDTANIIVSSFFSAGYSDLSTVDSFDPYPEAINIYNNEFSGGGSSPDGIELKALKIAQYGLSGNFPDIIWDGVINENRSKQGPILCVDNGDAVVLNVDAGNGYSNVSEDMAQYRCQLPLLSPVELPFS